ncbi:MAG: hypothetical protein M3362_24870, partial [Acidobacteriota bacterium]|nr:hypothetical protein [Acidobacteriota bacterium]
ALIHAFLHLGGPISHLNSCRRERVFELLGLLDFCSVEIGAERCRLREGLEAYIVICFARARPFSWVLTVCRWR